MIQVLKSTLSEVDDTLVVHSVGAGIGVGESVGGLGTGVTTATGFITRENSWSNVPVLAGVLPSNGQVINKTPFVYKALHGENNSQLL